MTRILLLEPDRKLCEKNQRVLEEAGYQCQASCLPRDAVRRIKEDMPDLVIMSVLVSFRDCRQLLHLLEKNGTPVLFTSCTAGNENHIRSLYHAPCLPVEGELPAPRMLESVACLLNRNPGILRSGSLWMDTEKRTVTLDGKPMSLTAQEFELLHSLMLKPNETLSREELLRTAWGFQSMGITRTVDVHVQRLRRKLGAGIIETVYQAGYRLRTA